MASYTEVAEYLSSVPAASPSWVEGICTAGLSMSAVRQFVATMATDPESPLRQAEEGILSKEIMLLNRKRGMLEAGEGVPGKLVVPIRGVLSPAEQTRVIRLVGSFVQPVFKSNNKFGSSGHAVMNAARRVVSHYLESKIPKGASVVEVGPDVPYWMLSSGYSASAKNVGDVKYVGARPSLTPRDSVRMDWADLVALVGQHREKFFSAGVVEKADMLRQCRELLFPNERIQSGKLSGEYVISVDSNYDIAFSDMPVAMGLCGARAWYGSMNRAKGLTRFTRMASGKLDLMGATYRVDWHEGKIHFRHPQCQAFGYSHCVWEYMKYEEHNGYVWTTKTCHYVYSKAPETTDELLFFSVVRVPKVHRMYEPRYTADPNAGRVCLTSVWSVGDEVSGVPTSFEKVEFFVDALNFSKVLEKRRALNHKGDLAITLSLVRSTNVRLWLQGTPVSVNERIGSKLMEATAVVVEAMVANNRLGTDLSFDGAMRAFRCSLERDGWFVRMMSSLIDLRRVSGRIVGPVIRVWNGVRASLIDTALSSLHDVVVSAFVVQDHRLLDVADVSYWDVDYGMGSPSDCVCAELAELRAAIVQSVGEKRKLLEGYLSGSFPLGKCAVCFVDVTQVGSKAVGEECSADGEAGTEFDSKSEDQDSGYSSGTCDVGKEVEEAAVTWRSDVMADSFESKSMHEYVAMERYLAAAALTEARVDATRLLNSGPLSDKLLRQNSTSRTKHVFLEFLSGRCVGTVGPDVGDVGAVYCVDGDKMVPVRVEKNVMYAPVKDGFHYSSSRFKVWNGLELAAAVDFAIDYGKVDRFRERYSVMLGAFGAGKTYLMMKRLSEPGVDLSQVVVVSQTKAGVLSAYKQGLQFGLSEKFLRARVMTADRYLLHVKCPAKLLCYDEFPMAHIGKVDAVAAITGAAEVRLYGDARQIPFDPFCAELLLEHTGLRGTVKASQVEFRGETHRSPEDVCAMWLDEYPYLYPCSCCGDAEAKRRPSLKVEKVPNLADLSHDKNVRYYTFKQDEKEDLKSHLGLAATMDNLRQQTVGGLCTVHEDQGATHRDVVTVRCNVDYDRNESSRNPSLYNRKAYVLTATTRHKGSFRYVTMCDEDDLVCKRIAMASDKERIQMVRDKKGMGVVNVLDMLS